MTMVKFLAVLAAGVSVTLAFTAPATAADPTPAPAPAWSVPSDAEIRQILAERIDTRHQGVGIVVGVIDAHGRRVVSYGALNQGDPRPLNGDTVFEIGSASKVFTSLLLSEMVLGGQVKLDDPAAKYLPAGDTMPERGGKQITLIDLATHTSGLPRLPDNFHPKDMGNPYADYTEGQLYDFLNHYTRTRDIGSKYEYSNLGVGLLGDLLSNRAGKGYEAMLHDGITGPLGMTSTEITLTPALRTRLAIGHDGQLKAVQNWDLPALVGAGGIRSDTNDLLTFLGAELGYVNTPLKPAMTAQLEPRRPTGVPTLEIALGWHIFNKFGVIWHNGGTGGYRSFMAFDPATGTGVVVLSNDGAEPGVDDIGMHIIAGTPLLPAPVVHTAIAVDEKTLQRYVGVYQLAATVTVTVTRDGAHLFGTIPGQPAFELFPEGPDAFFLKVVEAQVTFNIDKDGAVTALVLHQAGTNQTAPKVASGKP
jgi:serine-type D-Ala-D-Ala carboxypeptidase/endopeptidase